MTHFHGDLAASPAAGLASFGGFSRGTTPDSIGKNGAWGTGAGGGGNFVRSSISFSLATPDSPKHPLQSPPETPSLPGAGFRLPACEVAGLDVPSQDTPVTPKLFQGFVAGSGGTSMGPESPVNLQCSAGNGSMTGRLTDAVSDTDPR